MTSDLCPQNRGNGEGTGWSWCGRIQIVRVNHSLCKRPEVSRRLVRERVQRQQQHRAAASHVCPIEPRRGQIRFALHGEAASVLPGEFEHQRAALIADANYGRLGWRRSGGDKPEANGVRHACALRVSDGELETPQRVSANGGSESRRLPGDQCHAAIRRRAQGEHGTVVREAARELREVNIQRRAIRAIKMQRGHPVQVIFEVRVFIAIRIAAAISKIIRGRVDVETFDRFPPIRQAIVIGVEVPSALHNGIFSQPPTSSCEFGNPGEPPYGPVPV